MALGEVARTDAMTDDQLMLEFRAGDDGAFDALFGRYHTSVYRFARAMLADGAAAEEVLQESFLAVARSAGSYQVRGTFRAWLMRIVRNRCLNHRQAMKSRICGQESAQADRVAEDQPGPLLVLEQQEELDHVRKAIAFLPPQQREALLLHVMEQMPYAEVAAAMEIPVNTVKTLIHRARANLVEATTGEDTTHGM